MTRYTVKNQKETEAFLEPSPDGNWIWYSDSASEIKALQTKVDELTSLLKAAGDREDYFKSEGVKLRTQNRELRECVQEVLSHRKEDKEGNYVMWIGEGTFLKCETTLARIKEVEG